jgi:hypothetical protein
MVVNTDKCAELFEFSKHIKDLKKTVTDKTTEEVEFERAKEECTFKPIIHAAPPSAPKTTAGVPKFMQTDPQFTKLHLDR